MKVDTEVNVILRRLAGAGLAILLAALPVAVVSVPAGATGRLARPICRARPATSRPPAHPIVAFGDSITEGVGASHSCTTRWNPDVLPEALHLPGSEDTTYPGDLSRLLHRPVLDYGLGGELTAGGSARLRTMLALVHPSLVILLEGTNDLIHGLSPRSITGRLEAMTRMILRARSRVILLTVAPIPIGTSWISGQATVLAGDIRELAKRLRIPVADVNRALSRRPVDRVFRQYNGVIDYTHPGDAGYRVLADTVLGALEAHTPRHLSTESERGGTAGRHRGKAAATRTPARRSAPPASGGKSPDGRHPARG